MVKRLDSENKNKQVYCLDSLVCPCSTMYMIHPKFLLDVLEQISAGNIPNQILVKEDIASDALVALERMLSISP